MTVSSSAAGFGIVVSVEAAAAAVCDTGAADSAGAPSTVGKGAAIEERFVIGMASMLAHKASTSTVEDAVVTRGAFSSSLLSY